ncbi:MAG: polysaccharide lyase family 7 protein [Pseudomonas sp.]|uniref:polysaccharide lyase family 7 protein n=1 Tax=Pseudomonas sp. TaxID=306 RepID=UPI00273233FB|nr:polysaccharide lyase family 7 protein [Pseudomonas sp.]MDP3848396.1 polysaccharide lyase family 7 protein [Pseudomonas sp.]
MIDLSTWNLSIPVGVPATTITTPALAGGYRDYYFKSDERSIYFWAPVNGTTTKNASYPRSELRETYRDGRLRNWTYPLADNYMRASLKVRQVPSTGKLVIGQIHNANSNWPLLKLEFQMKSTGTADLVYKLRLKPTDAAPTTRTLVRGVMLNQSFSYYVHLTPAGTLNVSFNGVKWSGKIDPTWAAQPMYFKAGVYTQDNTGYETEAGAATFSRLEIEHRPRIPVASTP